MAKKTISKVQSADVNAAGNDKQMVTVVVTIQQELQVPMEANFKVTVPRKDAENHQVLLKACDEQEQEQDTFGYNKPQAGEWHSSSGYIKVRLHQDVLLDIFDAEVIHSEITGVVEPDEDEDEDVEVSDKCKLLTLKWLRDHGRTEKFLSMYHSDLLKLEKAQKDEESKKHE